MKKIFSLVMILALSLFASEEIHNFHYETDYTYALQKAKKEDKVLLLMMTIRGCPNCAYMKDIVFERENILNYINEKYVVALFDIEHDKRRYPKRFKVLHGPTFIWIDPHTNKEMREKKVGGSRPWKFIQELSAMRDQFDGVVTVDNNISDTNKTIVLNKPKPMDNVKGSVIRIIQ